MLTLINTVSKIALQQVELQGKLLVPPSKSDSQRAMLCGALAKGTSILENIGQSDDEKAMLQLIQDLGRTVSYEDGKVIISGNISLSESKHLRVGESGLTTRLMAGVSAAFDVPITLDGEGSILRRSLDFWVTNLPKFDVKVHSKEGFLPLTIQGPYLKNKAEVDGSQSSQNISGLLIGLTYAGNGFELEVKNLVSLPYLDMTLHTMNTFGVSVAVQDSHYSLESGVNFKGTNYTVESDWSSAAFWVVAGALGHNIILSGLNKTSLQADKKILDIVASVGAQVNWLDNELHIRKQALNCFTSDLTHCPDLFPIVALLATQCSGTSVLKGVTRLKDKESNRALAIQEELGKLNAAIHLDGDDMFVSGPTILRGVPVQAHNDHRIAMMLAIGSTISTGIVELSGINSVSKSYAEFWIHFQELKKIYHL